MQVHEKSSSNKDEIKLPKIEVKPMFKPEEGIKRESIMFNLRKV